MPIETLPLDSTTGIVEKRYENEKKTEIHFLQMRVSY